MSAEANAHPHQELGGGGIVTHHAGLAARAPDGEVVSVETDAISSSYAYPALEIPSVVRLQCI